MNSKKYLLPIFLLIALVQLYVPAKMIFDVEDVLSTGREYKFKTAPVDPNDPFRGKYISLRYDQGSFQIKDENEWTRGEVVYSVFTEDADGFATIASVSKEEPNETQNYFKTEVKYVLTSGPENVRIEFPFDRFYMEESKAPDAERIQFDTQRDTSSVTYALVNVKEGKAALKDVVVDGVSIVELVRKEQAKNRE